MVQKKRMLCWAAVICLLCIGMRGTLFSINKALAETTCFIAEMQNDESRLKLRKHPSTDSAILGQYYAGVKVTVYSVTDDWAKVAIGGTQGYMMRKFLDESTQTAQPMQGQLGVVKYADSADMLSVYQKPDFNALTEGILHSGDVVCVLGTVNDDWLHILVQKSDGSEQYGFVSSICVTKTENQAYVNVATPDAGQTVFIREKPKADAKVIGAYFSGVRADRLFDNHTAGNGWVKVRLGTVVGYISEQYVSFASDGSVTDVPPMILLNADSVPLYPYAEGALRGMVSSNDPICVLGFFGDRLQIRYETWLDEQTYGYDYGFIGKSAVKEMPRSSVSTSGKVLRETRLYDADENGYLRGDDEPISEGAEVRILFACAEIPYTSGFRSAYIAPTDRFVYGSVTDRQGTERYGYIPIEDVAYDMALRYLIEMNG